MSHKPSFRHGLPVGVVNILTIGPPGAGKGTQCARLAQTLPILHLSAGDLLREEIHKRSSAWRADWIAEHRAHRSTVKMPNEGYTELLRDYVYSRTVEGKTLFLIDGYPRTMEHLAAFRRYVSVPSTERKKKGGKVLLDR